MISFIRPIRDWHLCYPCYIFLYELDHRDGTIKGYNIGINNGMSAGQTIMHCHVHLIPTRNDDLFDPRGGVRGVIPDKMKY